MPIASGANAASSAGYVPSTEVVAASTPSPIAASVVPTASTRFVPRRPISCCASTEPITIPKLTGRNATPVSSAE